MKRKILIYILLLIGVVVFSQTGQAQCGFTARITFSGSGCDEGTIAVYQEYVRGRSFKLSSKSECEFLRNEEVTFLNMVASLASVANCKITPMVSPCTGCGNNSSNPVEFSNSSNLKDIFDAFPLDFNNQGETKFPTNNPMQNNTNTTKLKKHLPVVLPN